MKVEELVRKNILNLKPYSSARSEYSGREGIFLDANENAFGSTVNDRLNRYPDPLQDQLKKRLAELKGLKPEQIFLGNGSDEAIDLLIRAFCEPGKEKILIFPPTYGMYQVCAEVNNVAVEKTSLTPDFQIDTGEVLKHLNKETKLTFICSPNNPTGNSFPAEQIREILDNFHGLVVLDEAYIDFAPEKSWLHRLRDFPNLVILQTFSKAWGLANIRLGIALADPKIIEILNRIKYPYNVNGVTQKLALNALQNISGMKEMVRKIFFQRNRLETGLKKFPFIQNIYPSDANFLLVKMKNANKVFNYLMNQKIIVRNRSNLILCEDCLRITVGTEEENDKLLKAFASLELSQ